MIGENNVRHIWSKTKKDLHTFLKLVYMRVTLDDNEEWMCLSPGCTVRGTCIQLL